MSSYTHISSLIRLLDDESSFVKEEVVKKLSSYGPNLYKEIEQSGVSLTFAQKEFLNKIFWDLKSIRLKSAWLSWKSLPDMLSQLELALILLAEYLHEPEESVNVKKSLDQLAEEYKHFFSVSDSLSLAKFLFHQKGIKGNERDYYSAQNSNLNFVLQKKKGVPITLACAYMLVGKRLGLNIEGCHFPGHFLARVEKENGRKIFVDCFNEGIVLTEGDILRIRQDDAENLKKILYEKNDATAIIRRILANLIRSFSMVEDKGKSELMISLFKELEEAKLKPQLPQVTFQPSNGKSLFKSGQIVKHIRYGYKGIIVDIDGECQATDRWYYANQTQPRRLQAWYHVLVNDSDKISYVAESNLQAEDLSFKIVHPLVTHFFTQTLDGKYLRNDKPWPDMGY